jgi:hypothetical protein
VPVGTQWAPDHRQPDWPDRRRAQQLHLDVMVDDLDLDLDLARCQVLGRGRTVGGR